MMQVARTMCMFAVMAAVAAPLARGDEPVAVGATLTYQGQLQKDNEVVNGVADFQFSLWEKPTGDDGQVGPTLSALVVPVVHGVFTVDLDFGLEAFAGIDLWLDIQVRSPAGSGAYSKLTPRQPVRASPYSLWALRSPPTPWGLIPDMPAGFVDGVDDDTQYTFNEGLVLDPRTNRVRVAIGSGVAVDRGGSLTLATAGFDPGELMGWNGASWGPLSYSAGSGLSLENLVFAITTGGVSSPMLADGAVVTSKLGAESVTLDKLAANAVTSAKILDGTIGAADLAGNAVTSSKIADGTVGSADIGDGAIAASDIASDAASMAKVSGNACSMIGGVFTTGNATIADSLAVGPATTTAPLRVAGPQSFHEAVASFESDLGVCRVDFNGLSVGGAGYIQQFNFYEQGAYRTALNVHPDGRMIFGPVLTEAQSVTVTQAGWLGVGDSTPSGVLHSKGYGGGWPTAIFEQTTGTNIVELHSGVGAGVLGSRMLFRNNGGLTGEFNNSSDGTLGFAPLGATKMILRPDGKLAVGESFIPTGKLHVRSMSNAASRTLLAIDDLNAGGTGGNSIYLTGEAAGAVIGSAWTPLHLGASGAGSGNIKTLTVHTSGNVGIHHESPPFTLSVQGTAAKPGGGEWDRLSDARLKQKVRRITGALERLLQVEGVTFEYIDPESLGEAEGEQIGMIAQQVEPIFPQWVSETADGYKAVGVTGFPALCIEALRQLTERNDELVASSEALEERVVRLEQLVARLVAERRDE